MGNRAKWIHLLSVIARCVQSPNETKRTNLMEKVIVPKLVMMACESAKSVLNREFDLQQNEKIKF